MRGMKDSRISWVGEIPLQWNVYRNKDGFINTKTIVGENSKKTPLLSLTTKGIKLKDIDNPEGKQPESFDTYQCVETNDLVMCLFDLDISAVFSGLSSYDGMISPAYKVLKCNKRVIAKYADYWFRYVFDGRKFNQYAKNIRYALTYDVFSALPMLYPPVEEQQYIVNYLDTKCTQIDIIIAKEQSVIEKLQEYKQSVITEAVTKGLDPKVDMIESDISWIKTIPVTWKVSKLKYMAAFSPKCDFTDIEPDTEVTYTPMEYIKKGNYIANSEAIGKLSASLTKYEEGDIVIAKVTPCFENGNIAIMNNLKSGKGLGSSELFVFRVPEVLRKFVFYWMQNKLFIEQCVATMTGTGGLKRVSSYYISNSEILLPPSEAINDICNYLDEKCELIERTIHQKELVINKLTEYKQSLIYEVVTGKKEVPHV